jgi:hypothetical protein
LSTTAMTREGCYNNSSTNISSTADLA